MSNKRKLVALCGTYYTESVGDALLFECVKYLYKQKAKAKGIKLSFKIVDIYGRDRLYLNRKRVGKIRFYFRRTKQKIWNFIQNNITKTLPIDFESYYIRNFKKCDLIVVAGGGLFKYSVGTDFIPVFHQINSTAENLDIPVVYNALGVEGSHDPKSVKFQEMQQAFNNSVKLFSCRERMKDVKPYFEGRLFPSFQVADTGVWAKEAFNCQKHESNTVGINPVSAFFFGLHGKKINEEDLINLWTNLVYEVSGLGYPIQIFTNGNDSDYRFAKKIYEATAILPDINITQVEASNPREMISNISKCKFIIASRLHTCICAYSMDIPLVGLAWNDKLLNWGETINASEKFFDVDKFQVELIMEEVKQLENFTYDDMQRKKLKKSIADFAEKAVSLITDAN